MSWTISGFAEVSVIILRDKRVLARAGEGW
jgi:hypothetical protein